MIAFKDFVAKAVAAADEWTRAQEVTASSAPDLSPSARVWHRAE